MSDEQAYKNMKASPGLEIGLRPEQGTYELCDDHYDASKTEAVEHCAVCKLKAENQRLRDALQEIHDATPANRWKEWPHHHFYLCTARKALENSDE